MVKEDGSGNSFGLNNVLVITGAGSLRIDIISFIIEIHNGYINFYSGYIIN
jgi:hypothetical protein